MPDTVDLAPQLQILRGIGSGVKVWPNLLYDS